MTFQADIDYLSAGVPDLQNYLLSKELYYPIGTRLPQLTLGGILLSAARLGLRAELFRARIESTRAQWRSAWDAKSAREVKARGALWANYLAEIPDDSKSSANLYSQNARYRAMLTLLGQAEHETDSLLKGIFNAGKFVWEEECAQNFPRETFWYLFGTLKEK